MTLKEGSPSPTLKTRLHLLLRFVQVTRLSASECLRFARWSHTGEITIRSLFWSPAKASYLSPLPSVSMRVARHFCRVLRGDWRGDAPSKHTKNPLSLGGRVLALPPTDRDSCNVETRELPGRGQWDFVPEPRSASRDRGFPSGKTATPSASTRSSPGRGAPPPALRFGGSALPPAPRPDAAVGGSAAAGHAIRRERGTPRLTTTNRTP